MLELTPLPFRIAHGNPTSSLGISGGVGKLREMRTLNSILILLLAVGCMSPAERKLRNSVVGTYEQTDEVGTITLRFFENGTGRELYHVKGELESEREYIWKIDSGEVYVMTDGSGFLKITGVSFTGNPDDSLTSVAVKFDGG